MAEAQRKRKNKKQGGQRVSLGDITPVPLGENEMRFTVRGNVRGNVGRKPPQQNPKNVPELSREDEAAIEKQFPGHLGRKEGQVAEKPGTSEEVTIKKDGTMVFHKPEVIRHSKEEVARNDKGEMVFPPEVITHSPEQKVAAKATKGAKGKREERKAAQKMPKLSKEEEARLEEAAKGMEEALKKQQRVFKPVEIPGDEMKRKKRRKTEE